MKHDADRYPHPIQEPCEGDLYAVVNAYGRVFELRYGYYDDRDRAGPPDVIYPDFTKEPIYTDTGEPLATRMQDACPRYEGKTRRFDDATCEDCRHFERGEAWFGLCRSPKNKRKT